MGRVSGAFKLLLVIFTFYLLVQGSYAVGEDSEGEGSSDDARIGTINGTITGTINSTINITTENTAIDNTTADSEPNNIEKYEWILLLPIIYGNLLFLSWISRFFDKMNFCFVIFILTALLVLLVLISFCPQVVLTGTNNSSAISSCSKTLLLGTNNSSIFSLLSGTDNSSIFFYLYLLIFITVSLIIIAVLYSAFFKRRKEIDTDKVKIKENSVIINKNLLREDKDNKDNVIIDKNSFLINKSRVLIDENELVVNLHDIIRNFLVIFMGLMWPTILLYFHIRRIDYVTFYGIDSLAFPVYIIVASSIGILSYLYLSIEDIFCQLIPEYKKISVAWSYLRRITIAPFIALIGYYILNQLRNTGEVSNIDNYFVFVFSFFAGVFTKTIEEWIYAWVQKLLPGDKKSEFEARTEYQIKESEFVKKLRFDEDLAYALYNVKVRSIEELAASDPKSLENKLNFDTRNLGEHMGLLLTEQKERFDSYSRQQIKMYIDRARTYMDIDKSEFVTKLDMDRDLAFKLYYFGNIKTLEDLKSCNLREVHEKICDCEKEIQKLAKSGKVGTEEAHKILCDCSEEKIKSFKERAQEILELEKKKLELEKRIKSYQDKEDEESKEV